MTKHIGLKTMNQGTALATGTLALPPLVIEGLEEFKGSFDRLCLQAGTAAIEAMLVADAEQLCGKRYERHADRRAYRWGLSAARSAGTAARPRSGGHGCASAAGAKFSFPTGRRSGGGLAVALGVQPDADRCGDAQVRALGTTAGRRSGRPG